MYVIKNSQAGYRCLAVFAALNDSKVDVLVYPSIARGVGHKLK